MSSSVRQQHTQRGAALLLFVIFFLFGSVALTSLISKGIYGDLLAHRTLADSKVSYFTAESSLEDVAYRYMTSGYEVDMTEYLTRSGASATTTTVLDAGNSLLFIDSVANDNDAVRKVSLILRIAGGASFNFGVQSGNGGFQMTNSSKVIGNVFSNGNIIGGNPSLVEGDVIAAGPDGTVDGVHASGSIRADNILNSTIDIESFYVTSFVNNSYTNPPTQVTDVEATSSLPFPDSKVDDHKASVTAAIAAGEGRHIESTDPECSTGTFTIDTSTTTGILKVDCDMVVDKGSTVWTVTDSVWIEGNLEFKSGPTVEATPTISTTSVLIIVDDESDRVNSSQITVGQGTEFLAPSSPKSYIMLLSMNEDAELGGSNTAITMGQSSNGDVIIYAGHGEISLVNQITLKEVTGYLIDMGNNTTIEYESGLINLNFTSGPGGGFEIDGWEEVE